MYFLWEQEIGAGYSAGRNYSKRDCKDVFLEKSRGLRWVEAAERLSRTVPTASSVSLWPLNSRSVRRHGQGKIHLTSQENILYLCAVALLTGAGLDRRLFLLASLSWKVWLNDSIHSMHHNAPRPNLHTATSFLLHLFRDLILPEPLETGKEASLFL